MIAGWFSLLWWVDGEGAIATIGRSGRSPGRDVRKVYEIFLDFSIKSRIAVKNQFRKIFLKNFEINFHR